MEKMSLFLILLLSLAFTSATCQQIAALTDGYGNVILNEHAKSPQWNNDLQLLYWVDSYQQYVYTYNYITGDYERQYIPGGEVNMALPMVGSLDLLVAVGRELRIMGWDKEATLRLVSTFENTINEGKCDELGNLWAGTKGPQKGNYVASDQAKLYHVTPENVKKPKVVLSPVTISNGFAWNDKGDLFYYIDSGLLTIDAFDFDMDLALLRNRRTIFTLPQKFSQGIMEGMTIDTDGSLWVAINFNSTVLKINPSSGQILEEIRFPVESITSLAWGGPGRAVLYVTSSRVHLTPEMQNQPLAGAVFAVTGLDVSGPLGNKCLF